MRIEQLRSPLAAGTASAMMALGFAAATEVDPAQASREVAEPAMYDFCVQQARGADINGQAPNPASATGFHFPTREGKPVLNKLVVEGVGNQIGAFCLQNVVDSRRTTLQVYFQGKSGGFTKVNKKPISFSTPNAYDIDRITPLKRNYTGGDILMKVVTNVKTKDLSYNITCGLKRVTQTGQVSEGPC